MGLHLSCRRCTRLESYARNSQICRGMAKSYILSTRYVYVERWHIPRSISYRERVFCGAGNDVSSAAAWIPDSGILKVLHLYSRTHGLIPPHQDARYEARRYEKAYSSHFFFLVVSANDDE